MSENLTLWNALKETPPEYLKAFNRPGGFRGTSVDPTYRIMKLTQAFGPCGVGWRFVQEDNWMVDINGSMVAFVRGHLEYKMNGEWVWTSSHTGGTVCDRTPDEAYKMSETDACGKCCLDIGIAADVYLKEHDGDKYQSPAVSSPTAPQPTQAPHEAPMEQQAPQAAPQGGWRAWKVPIPGKNQGKTLGSLSRKSLEWYIENIKANPKYEDSVAFRKALDEAGRELNA